MDKLKSAFTDFTNKLQSQPPRDNDHNALTTNDSRLSSGRFAWPPRLTSAPRVLGEITDLSGRLYPRDMGRSIQLGGLTYYMFGDTFCFDASGDFCGLTNNTIALIPSLHNPTKSQWLTSDAKIPEFVPYSNEERDFCKRHAEKGENKRFVNWAFGGVIERPGSEGQEGWLFYETVEIHEEGPVRQCGIGLAKARVANIQSREIVCERVGPFPLFDADGPAWGNMSNIAAPDGWTYLLTGKDLDNYIARIRTDADFADKTNYEFFTKGKEWTSSCLAPFGPLGELAHDVLQGQGQGAIVYMPEHGPKGKPYMWFGCEKFMTSRLWLGAAERPEGPWELHDVGEMPKINGEQSKTRYCIYPHIWGSSPEKGELLISWSDNGTMGGKVATGVFTFATI